MSIDNKKSATRDAWIIVSAVIFIFCSILSCFLFRIDNMSVYIIFTSFLIVLIFRLATVKYFRLEISEHILSVRYNHPFLRHYRAARLELPWNKISFCRLEKNLLSHHICIGVKSKNRNKIYHYGLGVLSKKNIFEINRNLGAVQPRFNK